MDKQRIFGSYFTATQRDPPQANNGFPSYKALLNPL